MTSLLIFPPPLPLTGTLYTVELEQERRLHAETDYIRKRLEVENDDLNNKLQEALDNAVKLIERVRQRPYLFPSFRSTSSLFMFTR